MKRHFTLALCAFAALLALPASAGAKPAEVALSSFRLEGSNGYELAVTMLREDRRAPYVELQVSRDTLTASYEVRGSVGPGIHAAFGPLGRLDLGFRRRGKSVERPERGCRWVSERGVYRGSLSFTGEDGYVAASATNPEGEMLRLPDGFCGFADRRAPFGIPGLPRETVLRARGPGGSGSVVFEASRLEDDGPVLFNATLREHLGAMTIRRTARIRGRKGEFPASGASHARVFPSAPFTGSAELLDLKQRPPSWTGTLAVSFPGAPETPLAGETFAARLCPHQPILVQCRLPQPAG